MIPSQIDRYQIKSLLGQGSRGKVYHAFDPDLDREVALKIILPGQNPKDEWRQHFQNQIQAIARLNHPHIVTVYDVSLDHDPPYVVMEQLNGGALGDYLKKEALSWRETLTLLRPLAQALAYAHQANIIHYNLKPGNIMFTGPEKLPPKFDQSTIDKTAASVQPGNRGILKLVDLGLALWYDYDEPALNPDAGPNSPTYISPEQARGEPIDHLTDIFALGILFIEALNGHNPLNKQSILSGQPIDLSLLANKAPFEVINLIARATAKDKAQRYPSCTALLADLDHCLSDLSDDQTQISLRPASLRRSAVPFQARPIIQKGSPGIELSPEIEQILRAMFSKFSRIAIEAEFHQGLSGGRVYRVRLVKEDGKTHLPTVVKIAPIDLIRRECLAYQEWVANQLPGASARLESTPTRSEGSLLAGLRYTLVGEDVFEVESLLSYFWQANSNDLQWVLTERLYQIIGIHWWLDRRSDRAFQMQADYDGILPLNLILRELNEPPTGEVELIAPGRLPSVTFNRGSIIQLKAFTVTEIDRALRQVTLNLSSLSAGMPVTSYRLRLIEVKNLDQYRVDQVIDSITGQVISTRDDILLTEASRALGSEIDLSVEQLTLPVRRASATHPLIAITPSYLPNPLLIYQEMLYTFLAVNISTIHGDLNLENILIDPATRHINLIDFATVRRGHALHDLLRLETEVITKIVSTAVSEANIPPTIIYAIYRQLHLVMPRLERPRALEQLPPVWEKFFTVLMAIRKLAHVCLFNPDDWTEYYQGLILYLLGVLKFKNLDQLPAAPHPKQIAFWGAATLVDLMNNAPTPQESIPVTTAPTIDPGGYGFNKDLSTIARKVASIIQETRPAELSQTEAPAPDRRPEDPLKPENFAMAEPPAHIFICYKPVDPDQKLANYLYNFLTSQRHRVFADRHSHSGSATPQIIDWEIKTSDYIVVLLSAESVDSELVQAEVRQAYEVQKSQGRPHILPVRIAYEGWLPYAIDTFLDPSEYLIWQHEADHERIGQEIVAAISGRLPHQRIIGDESDKHESIVSEDGSLVLEKNKLAPPLPACDPRFLEALEAPGAAVKLSDKFYIGRDADIHLKRQIVKTGTITTIRAPRQTGKSSLLVRGAHHAHQHGAKVIHLDLQRVDSEVLHSPDRFLRYLAEYIVRKLRFNEATVEKLWQRSQGPQEKLTYLLEDFMLPASDKLIILAIDEADTLLKTSYHNDFFGMVRAWHNSAAYDEQWEKLSLVFIISTEPYLLISNIHQSPFNVGLKLFLEDFDETQVRDLNWRHGSPVTEKAFPSLMDLLNGHPYLTRKALYTLVTEGLSWTELITAAADDDGLFGDHLRRQHWLLRDEPEAKAALKQIIQHQAWPDDERTFYRLLRAGLVRKDGNGYACRCNLYARYFADKL